MKMNHNLNITFGATLVSNVNIKKLDKENSRYINKNASVVELDEFNKNDITAVSDTAYYWLYDLYGSNIAYNLKSKAKYPDLYENDKFFALTTQTSSFDKLNDKKIQGLVELQERDNNIIYIDFLQVNPDLIYVTEPPKYNHVGQSIIKALQDKYNDKTIILNSTKTALPFYQKLGFKKLSTDKKNNQYYWNKTQ